MTLNCAKSIKHLHHYNLILKNKNRYKKLHLSEKPWLNIVMLKYPLNLMMKKKTHIILLLIKIHVWKIEDLRVAISAFNKLNIMKLSEIIKRYAKQIMKFNHQAKERCRFVTYKNSLIIQEIILWRFWKRSKVMIMIRIVFK